MRLNGIKAAILSSGDKMESVWTEETKLPKFDCLQGDQKTDVLIIGGGIAGILCAYMLKKNNVDCVLVEANQICSGITKNTTAKITAQHGLIYDKLIRTFSVEKAQMYLRANEAALEEYRRLCKGIDCEFETGDAFVYSLQDRKKIEDELCALEKIGFDAAFSDCSALPFRVAGAVRFKNQAQFNPLRFLAAIVPDLPIYEHTCVQALIGSTAVTNHGRISAKKIIVATHFPFLNKHGAYFLKLYQHRSYVLALENAPNVNGMYVDEAEKGMSFRNYKNLLLVGGGGHRTGKQGGNRQMLRTFAVRTYPGAREKYNWAAQDCMTLDGVPYIGQYAKGTPSLLVATGFNKWGMTSAMAAAMLLADMVCGKENPYAALFSPSRTIMRPQLAANAFEATVNLLSFSKKRCPHLGCALKWNPQEHSWDCPCHGSRFTEDGKLIDNPATGNLK